MHTAARRWLVFLFRRLGCPSCLWRRAIVDDIAAVAASDNRRLRDCCVADCTIWHPGRPDIFILICFLLGELLLSVGEAIIDTPAPDNSGVVCDLLLLSHAVFSSLLNKADW